MGRLHGFLLAVLSVFIMVHTAFGGDYDVLVAIRAGFDISEGGTVPVSAFDERLTRCMYRMG